SRIADDVVPRRHGQLAGDDGGASAITILEDFEQIVPGPVVERLKAPIIKDQEVNAAKRPLQPCGTAVAAGEREIGEQAWRTLVEDRSIIPAGLVAESAGEPTLSDPRRAADGQIVMGVNPVAGDELHEQGPIETALAAIIDV